MCTVKIKKYLFFILFLSSFIVSCKYNKSDEIYRIYNHPDKNHLYNPIIINNNSILVKNNFILCFDINGNKLWDYELKERIIASPDTDGKSIYVVTEMEIVSINIENGEEKWRKENIDGFISPVLYYKNNLYIIGNEKFYSISAQLENSNSRGQSSVGQVHINQILNFGQLINTRLGATIINDMAFVILQSRKTHKFSEIKGIKLTNNNIEEIFTFEAESGLTSVISYENGKIYFTTEDNKFICLNYKTGELIFNINIDNN